MISWGSNSVIYDLSLAMLIFLYEVISRNFSVTSSTLKAFMKFWGTCFKFWLRPKIIYQNTLSEQKEGRSCDLCISKNKKYQFNWQNSYSGQRQMPHSTWKKLTGKLQVTRLYFLKEIAHFQSLFVRSNRDTFWENEDKINEEECLKESFLKLAGWHLATSLPINLFIGNFWGF